MEGRGGVWGVKEAGWDPHTHPGLRCMYKLNGPSGLEYVLKIYNRLGILAAHRKPKLFTQINRETGQTLDCALAQTKKSPRRLLTRHINTPWSYFISPQIC